MLSASLSNCAAVPFVRSGPPASLPAAADCRHAGAKGRGTPTELAAAEFGVVAGASGSVRVDLGASSVICSVYGPRAEKGLGSSARFNDCGRIDVIAPKVAPFARALDASGASAATLEAELAFLQRSVNEALLGTVRLDRYPKCTISVHLLVMRAGDDELEAAIAAACLAMNDASIEMYDLLCPCSVSLTGQVTVSACYSPLRDALPFLSVRGRASPAEVAEALAAARAGSNEIRKSIVSVLKARVSAKQSIAQI